MSNSHERGTNEISLTINGERKTVHVFPMERLLDVLRVELGLTGAKKAVAKASAVHVPC